MRWPLRTPLGMATSNRRVVPLSCTANDLRAPAYASSSDPAAADPAPGRLPCPRSSSSTSALPPVRAAPASAEELLEEVAEPQPAEQILEAFSAEGHGPPTGRLSCALAERLLPVHPAVLIRVKHLVVSRAAVGIAQDLVGLVHFLELFFRPRG